MGIGREGTFKKNQIGDLKLGFESYFDFYCGFCYQSLTVHQVNPKARVGTSVLVSCSSKNGFCKILRGWEAF